MLIKDIARICHEANRAYCATLGDLSQPTWNHAPEWQQKSAISGVVFVLDNPFAHPSENHENWLKQKAAEGWKFGKVKNPETKEHPCMIPWNDLPPEQQAKDGLFRAIVNVFRTLLDVPPGNHRPSA